MKQEINFVNDIRQNKDMYLNMLNNTNIFNLRNKAAEHGIEMTIEEVEKYLLFIRELCEADL